ncbi:MAG TPA: glucosamine-6-phosphate deaminase [Erysipelotrichaceae bacterium]|nr:glucosamine-6-phosphate deaminase [Erysipelotrichaceae bacterium]
MFNIIIADSYDKISSEAFRILKEIMLADSPVLGLATGSSPIGLYKKMIADHNTNGTSYAKAITFNLDEYIGIPASHEQSYRSFMHENLFDHIDIPEENIYIPRGDGEDHAADCAAYEAELAKYHIDLQILGIGSDGHIGFNEPGTSFDSLTHVTDLAEQTRKDNARFFDDDIGQVPSQAVTMGLASIMKARKILVIACGANKAEAVYGMIKGPQSEECPASILQSHDDVTVILDKEAAVRL